MSKYEVITGKGMSVDATDGTTGNVLEVKKEGVVIAAIDDAGVASGGFTGASAKVLTESVVTTNQDVVATGSHAALPTDLIVNFTTNNPNELVQVNFIGTFNQNSSLSDLFLGYQVDSDTPVDVLTAFPTPAPGDSGESNLSFTKSVSIPTAGAHSIRITAYKSIGTPRIVGQLLGRDLRLQVVVG